MADKPGLRFLRSTANRVYDHKDMMRTPDFIDRLAAAGAAKKAQIERARAIAEDPARLRRIEARSEIIAPRNIRIAERALRRSQRLAPGLERQGRRYPCPATAAVALSLVGARRGAP